MLGKDEIILGVNVLRSSVQESGPVFVPGRSYHSLTFRLSGSVTIDCGTQLESGPGCITFVPQALAYTTQAHETCDFIAVHFTTLDGARREYAPQVYQPQQEAAIRNRFEALLRRYRVGRERDHACLALFYEILAAVEHEMSQEERIAIPAWLREGKRRIDRDFGDSMLSISALSREAGVSEVYFRRAFNEHYGAAPMAYLKRVRLDNARLLLRTGYYAVGEVAQRCGFESLSYFSSEFHRLTGQTPTAYQNETFLHSEAKSAEYENAIASK